MNSLQSLDQKSVLGLTISCFMAILDVFTFLPGPLEDTFWSHGDKQILHFLQVAPDRLSPPASKQKQRPSQASVCHEAQ